jgi:hypothetical protein
MIVLGFGTVLANEHLEEQLITNARPSRALFPPQEEDRVFSAHLSPAVGARMQNTLPAEPKIYSNS